MLNCKERRGMRLLERYAAEQVVDGDGDRDGDGNRDRDGDGR